jgi:hypothetical protein
MGFRSMLLTVLALAAGAPMMAIAGDNMLDQMVRKACVVAVNKEVANSGKPAPDGLETFTCDCVVQQLKLKQTIDSAKVICKAKTTEKYGV